jgi:hypothetical protein
MVVPNILSIIIVFLFLTYNNVYQFVCTKQKAPDNARIYRSLQNCGCLVMNCFLSPSGTYYLEMDPTFLEICQPLI